MTEKAIKLELVKLGFTFGKPEWGEGKFTASRSSISNDYFIHIKFTKDGAFFVFPEADQKWMEHEDAITKATALARMWELQEDAYDDLTDDCSDCW